MDALYSWSLLLALILGIGGVLLGLFVVWQNRTKPGIAGRGNGVAFRTARVGVVVGSICLIFSVIVHGRWGHGAASAEPMDAATFVQIHPSFVVASIVVLIGGGLVLYAKRQQQKQRS